MLGNSHLKPAGEQSGLPPVLCNLPTLRPVALKMLEILSREDSDFAGVARLLQADPGFSAEILTVANSALYGGYAQVDTLLRALTVLGSERVKAIAMTLAMQAFMKNLPQTVELRNCWTHSRISAFLAEELAGGFRCSKDQAYTAALLHDMGRFGLMAGALAPYSALLAGGFDMPAQVICAEREHFGFDHCEAGKVLARTWNLPAEFGVVMAGHHDDQATAGTEPGIVSLVRAACQLTSAFGFASVRYTQAFSADAVIASLPGRQRSARELEDNLQAKLDSMIVN